MVYEDKAIHNLNIRKRIHQNRQKYPSPNKKVRFLDKIVMVVAIFSPLATLPQLYKIWVEKLVSGVSLFTWSMYFIFTIPLFAYGIVHKDKPIIVMYLLWLIIGALVVMGLVMFR